jgi:hypothetical protein
MKQSGPEDVVANGKRIVRGLFWNDTVRFANRMLPD